MWNKAKSGFTLVEIMVAISIFSIVALITTGALISANRVNQKVQATKLVMDNLNFALDSMLFKMRKSGVEFSGGGDSITLTQQDANPPVILTYCLANSGLHLQKGVGACTASSLPLTAPAITITGLQFQPFNINPNAAQPGWPRVVISLAGTAKVGHETTNFELQTTVSARQ